MTTIQVKTDKFNLSFLDGVDEETQKEVALWLCEMGHGLTPEGQEKVFSDKEQYETAAFWVDVQKLKRMKELRLPKGWYEVGDGVRFNEEHYKKVFRAHKANKGGRSLEGTTVHPAWRHLHIGEQGRIAHPEFRDGRRVLVQGEDGPKEYTIDGVYCQYWKGWYIRALIVDDRRSHGELFIKNLNSHCEIMIEGDEEFPTRFLGFLD